MSTQYGQLCGLILLEHFGEVVQKVGLELFRNSKPFRPLVIQSKLPASKVREALLILIKYGFVMYSAEAVPERADYTLLPDKVYMMLRYPRYLLMIQKQFGDEAEIIIELVLKQGQATASSIILKAYTTLKEDILKGGKIELTTLRDKFHLLVTKQFLMRCAQPVDDTKVVPELKIKDTELYIPPELNIKILSSMQRGEDPGGNPGDNGIMWRVNLDRFHQDIRDDLMVSSIARRIDTDASDLMRLIVNRAYLRTEAWAPTSNPVPFNELKDIVKKQSAVSNMSLYFEQYLKLLAEDSCGFIDKVGDSAGGQFSINFRKAFLELTWATIDNIVMERFGSKASRIFRLIRAKKYVEQEQIQQQVMIPAKEAKLLTYKLLEENFIQMQELRKSAANAGPNKVFFLFHINLGQAVRTTLEMCFKSLFNSLTRRESERIANRRLIEKQLKIDTLTQTLKSQGASEEQVKEIEDMMTPPELEILGKVRTMILRLSESEMLVDETIFILQLYLFYYN